MTTITFLRHGPTQENHEGRIQGQQHGKLLVRQTEAYLSAITPLLREKNPVILVSSDLERAVTTRRILKDFLQLAGIQEETLSSLRERSVGTYEGKLWTEIPLELQHQKGKSTYDFSVCGGEKSGEVAERVAETLKYFAREHTGNQVCCVAHACWLQQLFHLVSPEDLPDDWFDRTAVYETHLSPDGTIQDFNLIQIQAKLPQDLG
jgi:broad specificity phosphatase PhoE